MYKVTVWTGRIKPEDRNSRNQSGPTCFNHRKDVEEYTRKVKGDGGAVVGGIREIPGNHGHESLEEHDLMYQMSSDELRLLRLEMKHGRPRQAVKPLAWKVAEQTSRLTQLANTHKEDRHEKVVHP